ncbi:MAG: sigma-70 family RNA polymerase sigma factor [Bacteroidales bacterium]|nr:sigma-70 family RNA polymerase sigma factor [Bacteroidales bacterium]
MLKRHSDKQLIEGIRKGDDKSVNYLYDSFFDTIKLYVLKNTGTEDDAYDIFQDALMVLFKKIQQNHLGESTDVRGYIYGVSRNLWHEQLRKRKTNVDLNKEIIDEFDITGLLDTPLEQIVQRSFLKLKPECQKVLNMLIEGNDYKEIARRMNYKSEDYARRKKYLCKEALVKIVKADPEFSDYSFTDL